MAVPFERDIPWYPGEERPPLPTLETTTLGGQSAADCLDFSLRLATSLSNKEREKITGEILGRCLDSSVYYQFRGTLRGLIVLYGSEERYDESKLALFTKVLGVIDDEYRAPENVLLHFRFERHEIFGKDALDKTRREMESEMEETFDRDSRNIILAEQSLLIPGLQDRFNDFIKIFGSIEFAYLGEMYRVGFRRFFKRKPSIEEIRSHLQVTKDNLVSNNPTATHSIAIFGAADKLVSEGYAVEVVFEDGQDLGVKEMDALRESRRSLMMTLEEFKNLMNRFMVRERRRNQVIADQVKLLVNLAGPEELRMYAVFGGFHSAMIELLPAGLREVVVASTKVEISSRGPLFIKAYAFLAKIYSGDKVSQSEWEEAFNYYNLGILGF